MHAHPPRTELSHRGPALVTQPRHMQRQHPCCTMVCQGIGPISSRGIFCTMIFRCCKAPCGHSTQVVKSVTLPQASRNSMYLAAWAWTCKEAMQGRPRPWESSSTLDVRTCNQSSLRRGERHNLLGLAPMGKQLTPPPEKKHPTQSRPRGRF